MNADQFYTKLLDIVKPKTPEALMWEGGESTTPQPVDVVRFPVYAAELREPLVSERQYVKPLCLIVREGITTQEVELAHLYARWTNHAQYVYRVPTSKPSEFWLYLLVHFPDNAEIGRAHV